MKQKNKIKIPIAVIAILLLSIIIFTNVSKAITPKKYNLEAMGEAVTLLKYKNEPITSYYVGYAGKIYNYPAYCLDKTKEFITNELSYSVTEKGEVENTILWRYIVNGYPYKTEKELECIGRNEAYVATQQAIYCYIYGQKIEDYEPIGEAGKRTLQAMKNIIKNAQSSEETPSKQSVKINEIDTEFKQDNLDERYASKTYEITSSLPMKSYKVILENLKEEEDKKVKITDLNNIEKTEFNQNEKFKILLPKENIEEYINFKITIQAKIEAKPVIYAIPDNDFYQDFAIPASKTEEIVNETIVETIVETTSEKEPEIPNKEVEIKKLPITGM